MENCYVTKLRSVVNVNIDNAMYVDKGMLFFDNSISPEQTTKTNSVILLTNNVFTNVSCIEGDYVYQQYTSTRVSENTAANTKYHILYNLDATLINGLEGSGYSLIKSNFIFSTRDLSRCKNLEKLNLTSVSCDVQNIELFAPLVKLNILSVAGSFEEKWRGDVVKLADGMIKNGIDKSVLKVIRFWISSNERRTNITINGNNFKRMAHLVFDLNGYRIYSKESAGNNEGVIDDFSSYTPDYQRNI